MHAVFLEGSPRSKDSASAFILNALETKLPAAAIDWHRARKVDLNALTQDICRCDVLVIAFPLYVDAIPSHLLRVLESLESAFVDQDSQVTVYTIVNSGFFEPEQSRHALAMSRIWAEKCGFLWGQGLAVGAGEMLKSLPMGKGPAASLGKALDALTTQMTAGTRQEDQFVAPSFPRCLYKMMGNIGWRMQAKQNGVAAKAMNCQLPLITNDSAE